jgi:asparagine synthase (glutamine-hydrolysing)
MCGIAGLVDLGGREVRKHQIKSMTDSMKHRGPDGEGQWTSGNIGIGHRRLSIIDLSESAAQPMTSPDERFVLSYNGEIYNYQELRIELQSLGIQFRSKSDSEVLLYALITWKEKALLKFNGMFAFALYDDLTGDLLIARDRYGIKPLYYCLQDNYFSFASEQKAIKSRSTFRSQLDKETLVEYLTFQNIFTDKTLETDIKVLPAGHYLLVKTRNFSSPSPIKYWDFNFKDPEDTLSEDEYVEEFCRLFQQAIKRTLISDVEIGSYLSGGIDSGAISAITTRHLQGLKTFTVGFDLSTASGLELGFDERAKARAISEHIHSEHYEYTLNSGDMENSLSKLVWHLEEPRVGQSYPNLYAATLASKKVKVVLSGTGGDELFGGYPWRYFRTFPSLSFEDFVDGYYLYWQRLLSNHELKDLLKPIWSDISHIETKTIFRNVFLPVKNKLDRQQDYVNLSLYFEAKTFLHGLFIVEDKLSMSESLEVRLPFMDNDLVNFAMSLPVSLKVSSLDGNIFVDENDIGKKIHRWSHSAIQGKYLLRKSMQRYFPADIHNSPKQGFSSPDASWFKGSSINFVKERILSKENPLFSLISYDKTLQILNEHFEGKKNRRLLIWSLLHLSESLKGL